MSRFGQGILASLEDEEIEVVEVPKEEETTLEEVVQEDAENIENAVAVDENAIEKAEDQQDLLEDAAEELEEVQETLEAMKTAGDVPAWAAKMFIQRLDHINARTGARFAMPSVESMSNQAWTSSLEASIKENAAKAWQAIKAFFQKMVDGFFSLMDTLFSGAEHISRRAGKLAAAVKGKEIKEDEAKTRLEKVSTKVLQNASFVVDGKPTFIASKLAEGIKDTTQVIKTMEEISATIAENLKKAAAETQDKEGHDSKEVEGATAEEVAKDILIKRQIFDEVKNGVFAKAVSSWVPGGVTFSMKENSSDWARLFGRGFRFEKKDMEDAKAEDVRGQVTSFFGASADKIAALAGEVQKVTAKSGLFSKDQFKKLKGEVHDAVGKLEGKFIASEVLTGSSLKKAELTARVAMTIYYRNILHVVKTLRSAWLNGLSATLAICAAYAGV